MRKFLLAVGAGLLVGGGLASGQAPNVELPSLPAVPTAAIVPEAVRTENVPPKEEVPTAQPGVAPLPLPARDDKIGPNIFPATPSGQNLRPQVWGETDYLMWWLKNAAPAFPLVTTGDPAKDPSAGAIGAPSTRILYDGSSLDHGMSSGVRSTIGMWLDSDATWGLEASGFFVFQNQKSFAAQSDAHGNPPLYVPVYLSDFGTEGKFFVSDPTVPFVGKIAFSSATQFWGAEANVLRNLMNERGTTVDFLFGFRYLSLQESISLQASAGNDPVNDVHSILNERFGTRNDFFGGQFGARVEYRMGPVALEMLGKVAVGSTFQASDVSGTTTLSGAGVMPTLGVAPGTYPGAIFAQSSNIGHQSGNIFTLAPQFQAKLDWDINGWLRAFASYDILYWDNVVRPADQMDRNVNSAQSPLSPNFGTPLTTSTPARMFNRAEFWAQGVSVGLEFRY